MAERKAFNFFKSYFDVFNELNNDAEKLSFITALLNKQFYGIEPYNLKGMAKFAYVSQKYNIDCQVKGFEDKTGVKLTPYVGGSVGGTDTPTEQEKEKEEVKEKDYKKSLLSELKNSDFENHTYFDITISFYELFKKNITQAGGSISTLEKANGKWIDQIRLLIETDKQTIDNIRVVWKFLSENEFWKKNILSTSKLREKFNTLLLNAKQNGETKRNTKEGCTFDELAAVLKKHEIKSN